MENVEILPAAQFDYAGLDAETRIVVQQRTSEIRTIARRAASDVIEIGTKLIEVKERLSHGKFVTWLQAELGWSFQTSYRFIQVAERFQSSQIENFAPSALYMLASPSVPEEARTEAVKRAEAGEKITVKAAQQIIADKYATQEELAKPVRAAVMRMCLGGVTAAKKMLSDIKLASGAYRDTLVNIQSDPTLPKPCKLADIRMVCVDYLTELQANATPPLPAAKVVYLEPGERQSAPIWQLEQKVEQFLKDRAAMLTPGETTLVMLERMCKRFPAQGKVDYDDLRFNGGLPQMYREGDLQQALNNVLDHMRQAARPVEPAPARLVPVTRSDAGRAELLGVPFVAPATAPGIRTQEAVDLAAAGLRWVVRTFLRTADGTGEREALEHAARLTSSLLDLEGFHAARGRNFDWEALVAEAGPAGKSDPEALRRAVELERAVVVAMLAALPEDEADPSTATAVSAQADSQVEEEAPEDEEQPDAVAVWLQGLAEEQEIPQDRHGAPDREAARMLLQRILTGRTNGGEPAWRSLRYHPAWPEETSNEDKLAAVRVTLAKYTGAIQPEPVAPAKASSVGKPQIADPQVRLLVRKNEHIAHLVTAVDKALGYLKSLALRAEDPAEDLIETIAALEAARAAARNED